MDDIAKKYNLYMNYMKTLGLEDNIISFESSLKERLGPLNTPERIKQYEYFKNNKVLEARFIRQLEAILFRPQTERYWKLRKILVEAVKAGNQRAVSNAISHGADAIPTLLESVENEPSFTILSLAAWHGHHHLIDLLLKAGIDINDQGSSSRSPLHIAVERNNLEFATKIIEAGADIEEVTIEKGANTALNLSVMHGHLECIKLLLNKKVNMEALDCYNYTPLHTAAQYNQLSAIEMLLDAGCNRDARIHMGGTALHVAAMYNNREAVELLIKRGFDVEIKDKNGNTPMECAELQGHGSLVHWLAKLNKVRSNDSNTHSSLISGPLSCSEQTEQCKYSLGNYNHENKRMFDLVDPMSQLMLSKWTQLKLNIPRFFSGYYQDEKGLTLLHVASKNGLFGAVRLLIEEVEIHPNLKNYNGDVPADLAEHAGHQEISDYLKNVSKQKPLSIKSKNELYYMLLSVISEGDDVQEASRLLSQGAPLESYGKLRPSALAMAILWNRVMIIELLLAAGAPLTLLHHGKTLLQVAWYSPDVTLRVKIIIGQAYFANLRWERSEKIKNQDSIERKYLNAGLEEVTNVLTGETPWKAKWNIEKRKFSVLRLFGIQFGVRPLEYNPSGFSYIMGTAAKFNCKLAAFFLHQVGARPNYRTETRLGLTPLHEALDAKFYDLASVMVKHLGASLYIPDCNGRYPKDMMPAGMKHQLEKEQVAAEFNELEKCILSLRSETEKTEIKEIALALVCLYATSTGQWDHALCKWQDLHCYLVSLLKVKNKREDTIWLPLICQHLNQLNKENSIQKEEENVEFIDLLSCIENVSNNIRIQESILNTIRSSKTYKVTNNSIDKVLLKSVKIATENNSRTFLHLLFTIGKQSLDILLNNIIQSVPLHHAANAGNFSAILYLTLTHKASVNVLDRNNNTPAHVAYLNGHSYIGDYICEQDPSVKGIRNNAGQTPNMLREAFTKYEKLYGIVKDEDENDMSVNLTEQIDGLYLSTKLLEFWHSKTKNMSFRKIMENSIVDYSYGEAKLVLSLVINFAKSIGNKVAEYNPILKGTLVPVGSSADNVRLNAPDENDCTWILDWENVRVNLEDMSIEDKNLSYKHIIKAESDNKDIQYLLEGTNLLEEFYLQAVKAVADLVHNLDKRFSLILPGVKRIGCGVCITLAWAGSIYPMLIVSMDLVPAFKASRPEEFVRTPLTKNMKDPRLDGMYVVQTHIKAGEKRCSTTLEEQVVMQKLSFGQRLVFIVAKVLVSKLKTEKWASKAFKERFTFFITKNFELPAPTGFLLKSSFFKELERVPDPEDWKENCIFERLKGIFYSMCENSDDKDSLYSGLVPSYFSSTVQPPAAGFMAPAIYKFLVDNELELKKMEDSTSDIIEAQELERLAVMWDKSLNNYYYLP